MSDWRGSHKERARIESVNEEDPPEGLAVEVSDVCGEVATVRRGVVGRDFSHKAAIGVCPAL